MLVNLSFSGSGSLFPIHIGSFAAVEEHGCDVIGFAGTSGGAIVAALGAIGLSAFEIQEIAREINFKDLFCFDSSALRQFSLCTGKEIERMLKVHIKEDLLFKDVQTPLYIVATDLNNNSGIVFSQKNTPDMPVWLAVRASLAIPFLYTPVKYSGKVFIDGMFYNNIPVNVFKDSPYKTLGFQITSRNTQNYFSEVRWLPKTFLRLISMMVNNMDRLHHELSSLNPLQKMIFVDRGNYSSLDFELGTADVDTLHSIGYEATRKEGLPF